jgi:O-antigen ligase
LFSLVGICASILFLLLSPQELFPPLKAYPLEAVFLALGIFGYAIDLRLRRVRPDVTPQLPWVVLFLVWGTLSLLVESPQLVGRQLGQLVVPVTLYLLIAHGLQSFRALRAVGAVLLTATLFVATVGAAQGVAPLGCFKIQETGGRAAWDGRSCNSHHDCVQDPGAEAGADYDCEHVGVLGTQSLSQRSRHVGTLKDPHELALAVAVGLPFAFVLWRRTVWRGLLLVGSLFLVAVCAVFTRSRGGQLAFLGALAPYLLHRFRWRGVLLGVAIAIPMFLLGARDPADALASEQDRLIAWSEGLMMFRGAPLFGVGMGQFTEHHLLTARNSFVLAAAELGFPGLFLWTVVLYLSIKIPAAAFRRTLDAAARSWALALIAAWCAMSAGVFLLSFCYKGLFWIYVGLSGAFHTTLQTHDPTFQVRLRARELVGVAAVAGGLLLFVALYS